MKVRELVKAMQGVDQDADCFVMGNWWNTGAEINVTPDGRVFICGAGNMLKTEPPTDFTHREEVE